MYKRQHLLINVQDWAGDFLKPFMYSMNCDNCAILWLHMLQSCFAVIQIFWKE